jgi:cell division protein FtsL
MAMSSSAHAQVLAPSRGYERRRIEVLDGKQAKAREDAHRADVVRIGLSVATIFMFLLALTFMSAKVYSAGVEINSLKSQIEDTETLAARTELELGQLTSLDRIEAYATDNLGMVYPAADDIYLLGEESSLRIAEGQQEIALAEAEASGQGEENPRWRDLVDGIASFFVGSASAAEN